MGPNNNPESFKLTESATPRIAEEQLAQEKAAGVLAELSEAMAQYPIQSAIVEPTLTPKIYALGKINIDPLGIAGPNPMSYVDMGRNGDVIIKAFAAPSHDRFTDETSKYEIGTRVVLLQPQDRYGERESQDKQDLEFFGLNLFVMEDDNTEEPELDLDGMSQDEVREILVEAMQKSEKPDLMVVHGKPITGETSIFAIRHKEHGIVKFYSTVVKPEEVSPATIFSDKVLRSGDHTVIVPVSNSLFVEITQIPTSNPSYDDILNEFKSAITNLAAQQTLDGTKRLSPEEINAIRKSLSSGVQPTDLYEEFMS